MIAIMDGQNHLEIFEGRTFNNFIVKICFIHIKYGESI